jgi:hypothetical protein
MPALVFDPRTVTRKSRRGVPQWLDELESLLRQGPFPPPPPLPPSRARLVGDLLSATSPAHPMRGSPLPGFRGSPPREVPSSAPSADKVGPSVRSSGVTLTGPDSGASREVPETDWVLGPHAGDAVSLAHTGTETRSRAPRRRALQAQPGSFKRGVASGSPEARLTAFGRVCKRRKPPNSRQAAYLAARLGRVKSPLLYQLS